MLCGGLDFGACPPSVDAASALERENYNRQVGIAKQAQAKLAQAESCVSTYTKYPTHLQACLLTVLNGKPAADAYCSAAAKGKNPNAACKAVADNAARQLVDQLAKQKLLIK